MRAFFYSTIMPSQDSTPATSGRNDRTPSNTRDPKSTEDRLLTIKEAAHAMHVSPDTIRRRIKCGELPYVVIGKRSIRIVPQDLRNYVLRHRRQNGSPPASGTSRARGKH